MKMDDIEKGIQQKAEDYERLEREQSMNVYLKAFMQQSKEAPPISLNRSRQIAKIKEGFTPPFHFNSEEEVVRDSRGDWVLDTENGSNDPNVRLAGVELAKLLTDLLNEHIKP